MSGFLYRGKLPGSKAILNRLLLVGSYGEGVTIRGDSRCLDVAAMKAGLKALAQGGPADCADSATALRFLAVRASRLPGLHRLTGSRRLLSRPHSGLQDVLRTLGVNVSFEQEGLRVRGAGWRDPGSALVIDRSYTSQFASALLLNSWGLSFPLALAWKGDPVSEGYWRMSEAIAAAAGMRLESDSGHLLIPPGQTVRETVFEVEPDLSSAFVVASAAVLAGEAEIRDFPGKSLQPDCAFVDILREMGGDLVLESGRLRVRKSRRLKPIRRDVRDTPDLFPVLAVVCAAAGGSSLLTGLDHQVFKESDRIRKVSELLLALGREVLFKHGEMTIVGSEGGFEVPPFTFDPDEDHRIAMAAAVARAAGARVGIEHPEVVEKSFPELWEIMGSAA